MNYHRYLVLPTQRIIKQFFEKTLGLSEASYEIDYILAKLIEIFDEARSLRGESPATRVWEETFLSSIRYEGMVDYVDPLDDKILNDALRFLYQSMLAIFMHHEHHIHPDDNMAFCRLTLGDVIVGIFHVDYLTRSDVVRHQAPS